MRPKISTVITDLFATSESTENEKDESCDTNEEDKNHSKVSIVSDPIWKEIREIETTPALKMTWTKTNSQDRLMKLLKIDPRNIVSRLLSLL